MNDSRVIDVVHFHNCSGGGVLSVIKNFLRYSKDDSFRNHVIFTRNEDALQSFTVPELVGAASVQVFNYSAGWNFYYTCKKLKGILPGDAAIIAAHDWAELGMVSNLGLENPTIQFVHGDYEYYYDLAVKNSNAIDLYITVAKSIQDELYKRLPQRKEDIHYLRFPVHEGTMRNRNKTSEINIAFAGRLTAGKGYQILPHVSKALRASNLKVRWHIAGSAPAGEKPAEWNADDKVKLYGEIPEEKMPDFFAGMDFILLPSVAEGMPMVIVEAMKAGVIPLVNDIDGGVQEMVQNGKTGYLILNNSPAVFAEKIKECIQDSFRMGTMRNECITLANSMFEPFRNTKNIEEEIRKLAGIRKKRIKTKVYGSMLDEPWIPNIITWTIRMVRN